MIESFINKNMTLIRRVIQITSLLFIIAIPILNIIGMRQVTGTYYSISVGNLDITDPALVIQQIFLTKEFQFHMLLAGLIPLIITILLGKVFCGWVCPFNLIAEFADKIRRKLKPKTKGKRNSNPKPQYLWFVYATIMIITTVSGASLITFLSFPGLISAQIADFVFFGALGLELLIIVLVLIIEIFFAPRFWCKYVCPVGAVLAIIRLKHTLSIKYETNICADQCPTNPNNVSICNDACPLDLNPRQKGIYPYCYNCGACVQACQTKGGKAIFFTFHPKRKKKAE